MRFGKSLFAGLVCALAFSGLSTVYAANPKAGASCTKLGSKQSYKGKTFTCIKSGKKSVWNKGVVVIAAPKPSATPTSSPSAGPSPSSNTSQTTTPSPTPTPVPTYRNHYLLKVKLPSGGSVCPYVAGYVVQEVSAKSNVKLFGPSGEVAVKQGDDICLAEMSKPNSGYRLVGRMTNEAEKAFQNWRTFRDSRTVSSKVRLEFSIDNTQSKAEIARDVVGVQTVANLFGEEIGLGYVKVGIGFSETWLRSTLASDGFLRESGEYLDNSLKSGRCGAEFLQRGSQIENKPEVNRRIGDIYFCNWFLRAIDWPGNGHVGAHEGFHVVQMAITPGGEYQMWWYEGGAMFFGSVVANDTGIGDYDRIRLDLSDQLNEWGNKPLSSYTNKDEPGERQSGFLAIEYFVGKYGVNAYLNVQRKSRDYPWQTSLQQAFKEVTGQTIADFQKEAEAYISEQLLWVQKNPKNS